MKAFIIISTFILAFASSHKVPKTFNWAPNGIERIDATFEDGSEDMIVLSAYNPIAYVEGLETEENANSQCNFLGRMLNEFDSQVAVHGCIGDSRFEITIFCNEFNENKFIVNNGQIETLSSPFLNGTSESMVDVVEMNEDDMMEEGNLENNPDVAQATNFPAQMTMNMALGFDTSFANRHGGSAGAINELRNVLTVSQAHFYHSSLTTRIRLNVVSTRYYNSERWTASSANLNRVRSFASTDRNVHANAFFCVDAPTGVIGIAYLRATCATTSLRVSINEDGGSAARTADTLSHELGHNLGMRHDFDFTGAGCTGIMDYGNAPDTWSTCSVSDFRNYFMSVNPWCMNSDTVNPTTQRPVTTTRPPTTRPPTTPPPPPPTCRDRWSGCVYYARYANYYCYYYRSIRYWCPKMCNRC